MYSNLKVYTHSLAKIVELNEEKQATGVLVKSDAGSSTFKISAEKEVPKTTYRNHIAVLRIGSPPYESSYIY